MPEQSFSDDSHKLIKHLESKQLSRRDLLKGLWTGGKVVAAGLAASQLSRFDETRAQQETEPQFQVEVPPSIMLHARYKHEQLLPGLLNRLKDQGYSGVTYKDFLNSVKGEGTLPERPILISIDDLCMGLGVPSYNTFAKMAETLMTNDFPGVFAINTNPNVTQDDSRWRQIAGWTGSGIEFATHTALHTDLGRQDLTLEDYRSEIVSSAEEIYARTGQKVTTLILPFGNGYNIETGTMNQNIVAFCKKAGIQIVVGIRGGRMPIKLVDSSDDSVFLMGRTLPGLQDKETVESAMWEVNHWG